MSETTQDSGSQTSTGDLNDRLATAIDKIGFTRSHTLVILMVLIGVFIDVVEQNSVGLVAPSLQKVWGISFTEVGLLNSVTFGSMTIGLILNGVFGDLKGRKFTLSLNVALYVVGAVVCAFSPNLAVLFIGRFIVGVGLGGELAAAITYISEITATRHRPAAVASINVGAAGVGNVLSPAIAALILVALAPFLGGVEESWRWFFGFLILPGFLLIFYRWYMPETPRYLLSRGRSPEANHSLSVFARGRLRIKPSEVVEYFSPDDTLSLTVERVRLGDVFRASLRTRTIALSAAHLFAFGSQITVLTLLPTLLVAQGFSIVNSLLFTLLMQTGSLLGALASAVFGRRLPRRVVVGFGSLAAALSGLAFGFLSVNTPLLLVFGFLVNFFALLVNTSIWTWAPELYPTRVRAFGTSVIIAIGSIGPVVMPPIGGALLGWGGTGAMFVMTTVLYLLILILVRFVPETLGKRLEDIS